MAVHRCELEILQASHSNKSESEWRIINKFSTKCSTFLMMPTDFGGKIEVFCSLAHSLAEGREAARPSGGLASCISRALLDLHWRTDVVIGCLIHCIHPSVRPSIQPASHAELHSWQRRLRDSKWWWFSTARENTMTVQDGFSLLVWQANSLVPRSVLWCPRWTVSNTRSEKFVRAFCYS